jgi:hypothetical protein
MALKTPVTHRLRANKGRMFKPSRSLTGSAAMRSGFTLFETVMDSFLIPF